MAGDEIGVTVPGNLTADPELRFTPNGTPVVNFSVASTPRIYNRQNNEWKDGETTYLKCTAWRELAENAAETLRKGSAVIVDGKLITKSFETREGEKRRSVEVDVDNIGPSLRKATASITKNPPKGNGGYQGQTGGAPQGNSQPQAGSQQVAANDDPWADGGNAANDDPWA